MQNRPVNTPTIEPSSQRGFAESWGVGALIAVVVAGFCGICIYVLIDLRRAEWDQARLAATNLVTAIQTDIARNVELYDLSLQGVVENFHEPELAHVSARTRNLILFDRATNSKFMGPILVLDQDGRVIADSTKLNPIRQSHADADYFLVHQQNKVQGLYLSHVDIDGAGDYVVGVSRRISSVDEFFAGVVVGTLRLQYFLDTFRKLNLGPESSITLLQTDGTVLAREPFKASDYGRKVDSQEFALSASSTAPVRSFRRMSVLDGVERLFVHARVGELPLIVSVGISTGHIDAGWRNSALFIGLITIALCIITVVLVLVLRSEARQRREFQDQLAALASTDALTKLANRRGFDLVAEREFKRAGRSGEHLGLLMIDADRFKAYNDHYGHQAGDELLCSIADCIADAAQRGTDFAARIGGEEFAILITGVDIGMLQQVAEKVRGSVEELKASHPASPSGYASVSVGVACIKPNQDEQFANLKEAADRALYRAKDAGRNVVVLDNSVLEIGKARLRAA